MLNLKNKHLSTASVGVGHIISRDEMNLAEFPLTVLSKRCSPNLKTLEFNDSVKGKNGEIINRSWIITGADKFGLPTSSDDEVLLGLLKLSVDDGLKSRKIYFSRYELLKILKWRTEGRSYARLQRALDRLSGVRIKATNGFYDNESKRHSTKNFGIIDEYEINNQREVNSKPSFFVWSDVLFQSFQVGFIKKLDLDFYLSLKSAVSKRLYRYLDKHFWYKGRLSIGIYTLCHEKLGISRNYKYASSLSQQLDSGVRELVDRGFLEKVEYVGRGKRTEVLLYAAKGVRSQESASAGKVALDKRQGTSGLAKKSRKKAQSGNAGSCGALNNGRGASLESLLVERGISSSQASRLLCKHTADMLRKVQKIIDYYDYLRSVNSRLVSQSPIGFLYRAVENPGRFILPPSFLASSSKQSDSPSKSYSVNRTNRSDNQHSSSGLVDDSSRRVNESSPKEDSIKTVDEIKEKLGKAGVEKIRREVEQALSKIKGLISENRYMEVVEHGVEEKLLKLG